MSLSFQDLRAFRDSSVLNRVFSLPFPPGEREYSVWPQVQPNPPTTPLTPLNKPGEGKAQDFPFSARFLEIMPLLG